MDLTDQHHRVIRRLAIDRATGEVVTALAAVGVTSHLLKGPTFTALFYAADEERHYTDVDLLVHPDDEVATASILQGLGYAAVFGRWETDHAWAHQREADGVWLDLHRSVSGCNAAPAAVHAAMTAGADSLHLAGVDVPILGVPARLLHACIHAGRNGAGNERSLDDLRRALLLSRDDWRAAVRLAEQVGASASMLAGLSLLAEGTALADSLGLEGRAARARGTVPLEGGVNRLLDAPRETRGRLALALVRPSRGQVLVRFPWAGRSAAHRVGASLLWPFWVAVTLPRAVWTRWRRG